MGLRRSRGRRSTYPASSTQITRWVEIRVILGVVECACTLHTPNSKVEKSPDEFKVSRYSRRRANVVASLCGCRCAC